MDMEKFIGAVFIRKALWDKKDLNHHNRNVLDNLWKEVGREFSVSRDCARGRWKALRDKFRSTLNKMAQRQLSGDCDPSDCIISWPYYRSLLFLKEQFNDRKPLRPPSTYSDSLHDLDDMDKSNDISHDPVSNSFADPIAKYSSPSLDILSIRNNVPSPTPPEVKPVDNRNEYGKRRRQSDDFVKTIMHVENKKLKFLKSLKSEVEATDEDMSFFKSIIPHIKKLNSIDKMTFRIQVLKCVQDVIANQTTSTREKSSEKLREAPQLNGQTET